PGATLAAAAGRLIVGDDERSVRRIRSGQLAGDVLRTADFHVGVQGPARRQRALDPGCKEGRHPGHRGYFNGVSSRPRLLIATTSHGKLREWRLLLGDIPYDLVGLSDVGISADVDETGATFAENARLKADAYGTLAELLTLAEDSGLEVDALGGGPGVHS